jgi:signal transduction histidine kinase
MDKTLNSLKDEHALSEKVLLLETEIAILRRENVRLMQQVQDDAVELEATVDEFNRAKEETEHAKEETERAKEAAERANVVKSAFLASMSHELRTPLNAILNFSQFLASGMLGPVNQEQIDMLEKVTGSGKHLLNLINDVLDISKIESGSLRLFLEENVDLSLEAKSVADTAHALLVDKPVELRLELAPDLPRLIADKRRIRQIMLNLVSNACKFTMEGHVTLSLSKIGDEVRFSVKDTGPGIALEDYEIIFEAFRQTHAGVRHGSGTGLGLAISRRLAEAHYGRLWLESELGVGSTFHVAFPVHSPALVELLEETRNDK